MEEVGPILAAPEYGLNDVAASALLRKHFSAPNGKEDDDRFFDQRAFDFARLDRRRSQVLNAPGLTFRDSNRDVPGRLVEWDSEEPRRRSMWTLRRHHTADLRLWFPQAVWQKMYGPLQNAWWTLDGNEPRGPVAFWIGRYLQERPHEHAMVRLSRRLQSVTENMSESTMTMLFWRELVFFGQGLGSAQEDWVRSDGGQIEWAGPSIRATLVRDSDFKDLGMGVRLREHKNWEFKIPGLDDGAMSQALGGWAGMVHSVIRRARTPAVLPSKFEFDESGIVLNIDGEDFPLLPHEDWLVLQRMLVIWREVYREAHQYQHRYGADARGFKAWLLGNLLALGGLAIANTTPPLWGKAPLPPPIAIMNSLPLFGNGKPTQIQRAWLQSVVKAFRKYGGDQSNVALQKIIDVP